MQLYPDHIDDKAVLDEAEIPTLQDKAAIDSNADGTVTAQERSAFAATTCHRIATGLRTTLNNSAVDWTVVTSDFSYHPGAVNLQTGRTECTLRATIDLSAAAVLNLRDTYRTDRVGWHEITAVAHHVLLTNPPVPATSLSDELLRYPNDLLASPLDQRTVRLNMTPGSGRGGAAPLLNISAAGPLTRALAAVTDRFNTLVGAPRLTPVIGLLAVALALLLGAAHAALPGHGKTVMAAYLAGRRGSTRDAITVGATVTATHTCGVLILGLILTLAAGFVGEALLGWLGAASGLLIAAIGAGLLTTALTNRLRLRNAAPGRTRPTARQLVGSAAPTTAGTSIMAGPVEASEPDEPPIQHHHHGHHHHGHHHPGHHHHGHHHPGEHEHLPLGRRGLIGMGVAGGLVPSPSALIVLLGAIALGRSWFGVLLVLAYGAGMAATLTAAGLVLVHLRNRLDAATSRRASRWAARIAGTMPIVTASLVLIVGLGLALRSVLPLLNPPA